MFRKINSPNFWPGRKGHKPEAIVIHITEGSLQSAIHTIENPANQVSYHWFVARSGKIIKAVEEKNAAWHTGVVVSPTWRKLKPKINPNLYTIGIGLIGKAPQRPTLIQTIFTSWLILKICTRWSIKFDSQTIIPHNWIHGGKTCPGKGIKVDALIWLAQILGD